MNTTPTQPKKYWFKAKRYGWGWTPATWQGWLVLIIFLVATWGNFYRIEALGYSEEQAAIYFSLQTALLVIILLAICYKTGEKPRWRWGDK